MVIKIRIHECVLIDKNIHILFIEQEVCGVGTKWKKAYLTSVVNIAIWLHWPLAG